MFRFDLYFNTGMLLVSAWCVYMVLSQRDRNSSFRLHAGLLCLMAASAAVLLLIVYNITPRARLFMPARFLAMCLFWYLPGFLAVTAAFCAMHDARRALHTIVAALCFVFYVYAFWIEPHWLEVTHHTCTHPLLDGLQRPVKIAQIADFQAEKIGAYERRVLRTVAEERPDIVAFCGDNMVGWPGALQLQRLRDLFAAYAEEGNHPPLGTFVVGGDVDMPDVLREAVQGTGIVFLEDEVRTLSLPGVDINLIGLSLHSSRYDRNEQLPALFYGSNRNLFTLIVAHAPDYCLKIANATFPGAGQPCLALAGHTHGGQVRFPFFGPLTTASSIGRKYADAYVHRQDTTFSISRGIGLEAWDAPRIRFLCRPELRFITLMPPSKS